MTKYYYASLDKNNMVTSVSEEFSGKIHCSPNFIPIATYDTSLVGKYYDSSACEFISEAEHHLRLIMSVDGSGSGLDADKLDGIHASNVVTLDSTGKYATVPTPDENAPMNAVPNLSYISKTGDDSGNNILHTEGNETAEGEKTIPKIIAPSIRGVHLRLSSTPTAVLELGNSNTARYLTYLYGLKSMAGIVHISIDDQNGISELSDLCTLNTSMLDKMSFGVYVKDGTQYLVVKGSVTKNNLSLIEILNQTGTSTTATRSTLTTYFTVADADVKWYTVPTN